MGHFLQSRALVSCFNVLRWLKPLPTMQETWVQSLGREDLLKKWHPTPVFLPGKSHGRRSLVGYSPRDHKESTQLNDFTFTFFFFPNAYNDAALEVRGLIGLNPGVGRAGPSRGSWEALAPPFSSF